MMNECKPNKHMWFLDNDVSNHMCGDKFFFIELDIIKEVEVKYVKIQDQVTNKSIKAYK
jgi:hypothetical protein